MLSRFNVALTFIIAAIGSLFLWQCRFFKPIVASLPLNAAWARDAMEIDFAFVISFGVLIAVFGFILKK